MIEINIAQALENYANSISDGYQTYLAYGGKTDSVVEGDLVVLYDAVNLIKHQQAEIDRVERHTEMYHELRAEAIKEFAERLKEVGIPVEGKRGFEGVFVLATNFQIDNLVKEMVGEDNG